MKINLYIVFIICLIFTQKISANRGLRKEKVNDPVEQIVFRSNNSIRKTPLCLKKQEYRLFNKKSHKNSYSVTRSKKKTKNFSKRKTGEWLAYLFDDFEGDFPGYWLLNGSPAWGVTSYRSSSGNYSVWCAGSDYSPGGGYLNNMNSWMIDGPFDMTEAKNVELYFDYWINSETDYDSLFVGVSTDGESFYGFSYSGDSEGWLFDEKINFAEYAGVKNLYIAVQFKSDNINCSYEGSYIDNIELDAFENDNKNNLIDLKVYKPKVLESKADDIFKFRVKNLGPGTCKSEGYLVKIFVDGEEDSSSYNQYSLYPKDIAIWEWQLAYLYPPGLHIVKIELFPLDTEITPENNYLEFHFLSKGYNLTIPNIPTTTGAVSTAFSMMLLATNGAPPYAWRYENGKLPAGLFISGEGVILGTPQKSGSYTFTVAVEDAGGNSSYKEVTIEIIDTVFLTTPQIYDRVLPTAFVNSFYEVILTAVGGLGPYNWSKIGNFPGGFNISISGVLSGAPTIFGNFTFPVFVEGSDGYQSKTDVTLRIKPEKYSLIGNINKSKIIEKGNTNDSVRLKANFDIPENFVLDKYARIVIYISDYPVSFGKPKKAKWRKKAVFRTKKYEAAKSKVTLRWNTKNKLKFSFSLKNVDLKTIFNEYNPSENVVPIRIVINDHDTGIIQQSFKNVNLKK